MAGKVYNADEVMVAVNGIPLDSGYDDGEFLTIEFDTDKVSKKVGTNGEVVFSKTRDRSGTITIKLLQTSTGNAILTALSQLYEEGKGQTGIVNFAMEDLNNGETFAAAQAVVAQDPAVSMDREATGREWKLFFAEGKYAHPAIG
jgi:hypothetical protein